jgi:hypothetical protein
VGDTKHKQFGFEFFMVLLLGPLLSFFHLLLIGHSTALDKIFGFPLFLFPWPNDPAVKLIVLVNSALWGFGIAYLIARLMRASLSTSAESPEDVPKRL